MAAVFGMTGVATAGAAFMYASRPDDENEGQVVAGDKPKRTRVPLDAASTMSSLSSPAQKLVVPSVVEEIKEEVKEGQKS